VGLAKEILHWGYYRIEGELKKLGFDVSGHSSQCPQPKWYSASPGSLWFDWLENNNEALQRATPRL